MMVFIKFEILDSDKSHYFVGVTCDDIFADLPIVKRAYNVSYGPPKFISKTEAKALNLGFLHEGIQAMKEHRGKKSFKLGSPK
jgi:hypothetical protein